MKKMKHNRFVVIVGLFLLLSLPTYAQNVLQGKVTDVNNESLIGVSVYLKGTTIGAVTDISGNFNLEVPSSMSNPIIIFSMIGYLNKEVTYTKSSNPLNIVLMEDVETLSEVVVTGYTTEQVGKITGSVSTIDSEALIKTPVPTLDQALQGRAPGVVVTQNTGAPGEGVGIRIRGVGSINSGNYPLYVVDGIPTLDINAFSIQDIKEITVLKDASAAALYGSRAANGVVIITTKSGSSGAPRIQINSQIGVQSPTRLIKMANTAQYVELYNESAANDNVGKSGIFLRPTISEQTAANFDDVNYLDEIFRDAIIQNHTFSISGSEGRTNYLLSGSYFDQEGIIKSSDFNRVTGRINLDTQLKDWLSTGINLSVAQSKTNLVASSGDGAGGNGGSVVRYALFRTPAISIYNSDGSFVDRPDQFQLLGDGYNPLGLLAYNQNEKNNNRLFGKYYVKANFFNSLNFVSNFGVDINTQNQRRFDRNWGTSNRINNPNRLSVSETRFQSLTFSNFLTYDKSIGSHNLTLLVGTEAIKNQNYGIYGTDNDFPDQEENLVYLGNGQGLKTNTEGKSSNSLLSYFGKISYDYDAKYLASATVRRDGSSRFGLENRWGTFYAGSLGWRIDKEAFLTDNSSIDLLLLRAGYGQIGNQEISDFPSIAKIGTSYFYPYGTNSSVGYAINQLGNNQVKWETSNQFNAGFDFETFNGSLLLTVDYFNKVTSDLLVSQPIASSAGLASPAIVNNGKVLNSGYELAVTYEKSVGKLNYAITGNVATLHNEILKVDPVIQGGAIGSDNITLVEKGFPIGSFYLYEMEGIFQNETEIFTHANQGNNIKPGDVKYKDQNNDGVIDGEDRVHTGSPIPKVTAGLNLSFNYLNWDLSIFIQGAYGQKIFSVLNRDIEGFYRPFNITERYYENRWTGEGSTNEFPRASWDASGINTRYSTRFLEDGSYTRLKNLQIGYSLPKELLSKFGCSALRVYLSGTNLFTLTNYQGLDPEMTVSDNALGQGDRAAGIDWGTYPSSKSYNVGVSITF